MAKITDNANLVNALNQRQNSMTAKLELGEKILNTNQLEMTFMGALVVFYMYYKNLDNSPFFDQTLNDIISKTLKLKNNGSDHDPAYSLIGQAALLVGANYLSLEVEKLDSKFVEDSAIIKNIRIADIFEDAGSYTDDELKQVLTAIRCNLSHNKEAVIEEGFMSSVKFTNHYNILIETSVKGKPKIVVKTSLSKLSNFVSQIADNYTSRNKEHRKKLAESYAKFMEENPDKSADDFIKSFKPGPQYVLNLEKFNKPLISYFESNMNDLLSELVRINYTNNNNLTPTNQQILEMKNRLKLYKHTIQKTDPTFFKDFPAPLVLASAIDYVNSYTLYLTNKTNTNILYSFLTSFTHDYPTLEGNLVHFLHSKDVTEKRSVQDTFVDYYFNTLFLYNDMYPAAVMNLANTLFTNHQTELTQFLDNPYKYLQPNEALDTALKHIQYKKPDIAAKLRNSIHHGRYMFFYPNKSDFDPNDISVQLYDGPDNEHLSHITKLSIRDITNISMQFNHYIENRQQALGSTIKPSPPHAKARTK